MQSERMNLISEFASEQFVDQTVLCYQVLILKIVGYHDHLEVRFRSRGHVVLPALICHLQMQGRETLGELPLDNFLYAHGTVPYVTGDHYMAMVIRRPKTPSVRLPMIVASLRASGFLVV